MLFTEVLKHIYREGEKTLGRAVFEAKCTVIARYPTNDYYYGPAVLWTLFGDPALRIKHRALTGVEERPTPDAPRPTLLVAPNPCRAGATVRFSGSSLIAHRSSLSVYNASGRLILSQPVRSSPFTLHPSLLPAGVYVVELTTPPGAPLRQKLVVR